MPRKRCCGRVDDYPMCRRFEPAPADNPGETVLGVEEMEAVRLKDMLGYDQETCAREMGLTRPTFQRILAAARKKIATALTLGQAITIQGGHFVMKNRVFECQDCKKTWEEPPCTAGGKHGYEIACPQCGSMNKVKLENGERHACGGAQHHHGNGGCGCSH